MHHKINSEKPSKKNALCLININGSDKIADVIIEEKKLFCTVHA